MKEWYAVKVLNDTVIMYRDTRQTFIEKQTLINRQVCYISN